jgi:glucose/arabinose dehydrogenase
MTLRSAAALALVAIVAAQPAFAQGRTFTSQEHGFRLEILVEGLEHPWAVAFLAGGDMLITERPGRLRMVRGGRLSPEPVAGVPEVWARGQGGLLDVVPHPGFARNRLVYLSYSKPGPRGAATALARARLEDGRLAGVEDVFVAEAWGRGGAHFGSRIVFDREGRIFLSVGERGEKTPSQDLASHKGKIVRLMEDGRAAPGNPFAGRAGALPEIYSYGHRNPQGMALHPSTGALWANEHGARGGDEINLVRPGVNYGWPVITLGVDYSGAKIGEGTHKEGMEQPLHHWTPSIAPSGMAIYDGAAFPKWRGSVFSGALVLQHLNRVAFDGTRPVRQERLLTELRQRIRDVRQGPDGYLYILTDEPRGILARLVPAG